MKGIQLINYDIAVDVVHDASGQIVSGLIVGDILYQNQALIVGFQKGDLKGDVSVGVGIERMLLDNDKLSWKREIQEQLEMDGQTVAAVEIGKHEIIIKARY